MNFQGFKIKQSEIESVTIRRNGTSVTISKGNESSPKVEGFNRPPKPPADNASLPDDGR